MNPLDFIYINICLAIGVHLKFRYYLIFDLIIAIYVLAMDILDGDKVRLSSPKGGYATRDIVQVIQSIRFIYDVIILLQLIS